MKTREFFCFFALAATILAALVGLVACGGSAGTPPPPPPPPPVSVSVSPTTATLHPNETQQFTATVSNATDKSVTWTATSGTVDATGLYTAPATIASQTTATVKATSKADTTKSASATVTLQPTPPPPITVTVSPKSATLSGGQTQQFAAAVTGTSNTAVTWTATVGTVSAAGLYTAPATIASQTTATVKATSQADNTKSDSATVTLVPRTPPTHPWTSIAPAGGTVQAIAEDITTPCVTYGATNQQGVGSGLWKSTDCGKTWAHMVTNSKVDFYPIADVFANGQTIYVAIAGPFFVRSADGGNTWSETALPASPADVGGMTVDPTNDQVIYLSGPLFAGVFKSTNGGASFQKLANAPKSASGMPLHHPIAVDPQQSSTVYYGTDQGLFVSPDGGTTWPKKMSGIAAGDVSVRDVFAEQVSPFRVFALVGLAGSTTTDLYLTSSKGQSWQALGTGLDAERVIADRTASNTLYLSGLISHAVYKSTDGGATFAPADAGLPAAQNGGGAHIFATPTGTIVQLSSNALLTSIMGAGIYRSGNGAASWTFSSAGVAAWYGEAIAEDPQNASRLFLGTGVSLSVTTNGGGTWATLLANDAHAIAVDPGSAAHLLVCSLDPATAAERLLESKDSGTTWKDISSLLPGGLPSAVHCTGIVFNPLKAGTVYLLTTGGNKGVFISSDSGKTWTLAVGGLGNDQVFALAVSPQDGNTLILGTLQGVYKSTDGAASWSQVTTQMADLVSIDAKANPPVIYANGVKSVDTAGHFSALTLPAGVPAGVKVVADPTTANSVFLLPASVPPGDFWSPDGGTSWQTPAPDFGAAPLGKGPGSSVTSDPQKICSQSLQLGIVCKTM